MVAPAGIEPARPFELAIFVNLLIFLRFFARSKRVGNE